MRLISQPGCSWTAARQAEVGDIDSSASDASAPVSTPHVSIEVPVDEYRP